MPPEPTLGGGHVGASVFLMTAAMILVKTGRDALFFQKDGLFDLGRRGSAVNLRQTLQWRWRSPE